MLLLQVVSALGSVDRFHAARLPPVAPDPAPTLEERSPASRRLGLRATAVVASGAPAGQILLQARKFRMDLIAMATSGRKGISRFLMGSVAEDVVRHMDRPVLLHRIAPIPEAIRRIQEQHAPGSD